MGKNKDYKDFRDYVEQISRTVPHGGVNSAIWASQCAAGWRLYCERVKRSPDMPPPVAEDADAERWAAEALRQAQWGKNCMSAVPFHELAKNWLAMNGRHADGRRFAEPAT